MANNQSNQDHPEPTQRSSRLRQLAWMPVPLAALTIAGLWIADLRTVYESRLLMVLLNLVFTWLASLCICLLTARGFLAKGQPALLMFGCGSLLWGVTSLAAAAVVDHVNLTVTVHNLGVFGAASCHLVGLLWRGRLRRPGRWLVVGYAGALMTAVVIFRAAWAGALPVFFIQGQGGTPVREVVLFLAVAMFAWVAWHMIQRFWRQAGAFYYWYGLGLALVATGLTGVLLLSVQGSILGWTNRLTQYLGSAYLFVAAFMAAREAGAWTLSLAPVGASGRENLLVAGFRLQTPLGWVLRYGLAAGAVAAALGLRQAGTWWVGPGLPTYITFYPAVMVGALLGGIGPGLLATALVSLAVGYWILPPVGQFAIATPVDRLGLVIFIGMGLFMSVVAELYRRYRHKAAAYDREAALRDSQARLAIFAAATFEGIVESEGDRIVDCNEQLARMLGYSVTELKGVEIASLIEPEDRDRVMANIRQGQESLSEHAMLRKDGTRIVVEARGQLVFAGSARRHTAIRDITARKGAETALQTALQRFYHVLSSMSSGLLLLTDEGQVEFANQAICDQFGLTDSPASLMGLEARDMIEKIRHGYLHPDEAVTRIREMIEQAQPVKGEEIAMEGGRTCLRDFVPLKVHGKSCGRLWLHFDISARKEAEVSLRKSRERLDLALTSSRMATFDWDIVQNKRAWSQGVHALLGTKPETFTGTAEEFFQIIHPEDRSTVQSALARAVESFSDYETEYRAVWPDGSVRHISARGKVQCDSTGRAVQMTGVCWDITERRRAEEAVRESEARYRNLFNLQKQAETEIRRRVEELKTANEELTRFNRVTVGRELRIIQLKQQVNDLCARLHQPPRYATEPDERARPTP